MSIIINNTLVNNGYESNTETEYDDFSDIGYGDNQSVTPTDPEQISPIMALFLGGMPQKGSSQSENLNLKEKTISYPSTQIPYDESQNLKEEIQQNLQENQKEPAQSPTNWISKLLTALRSYLSIFLLSDKAISSYFISCR